MAGLRFLPLPIRLWHGRYARIPGDSSVFHVRFQEAEAAICIDWDRGDERGTCLAVETPASQALLEAVLEAKRWL